MAGKNPHPAVAGKRVNFTKYTASIVRHRTPCANCGTPLHPREFRYCQPCAAWLGIYARTCEIARLLKAVKP